MTDIHGIEGDLQSPLLRRPLLQGLPEVRRLSRESVAHGYDQGDAATRMQAVVDWVGVIGISLPLFALNYSTCVSYAQLIVTGSGLKTSVVAAMHLFSSGVAGIILPLLSNSPLCVPSADMASTIFFQQIVKDIVIDAAARGAISSQEAAATAQLALPLNTILLGCVIWLIGKKKKTVATSYLPYPVVAGFLGTIGWAIFAGSFDVLSIKPLQVPSGLPELASSQPYQLGWAIIMALSPVLLRGRLPPTVLAIGPMFVSVVVFWIWVAATGQDLELLRDEGWLFPASEPLPFWKIWTAQDFAGVQLSCLTPKLSTFFGLGIVVILSLVLRIAGIEGITGTILNLDAEVEWHGLVAMGTGMMGTVIGSHSPGLTIFNMQSGRTDWRVAVTTATMTMVVWFSGLPAMEVFPRFVLSGILMSMGIVLLMEWMWKSRMKVGYRGLMVIYTQVTTSIAAGLLPSVLVGIVVACVMVQASLMNLNVLKYHLSGKSIRSYVHRTEDDRELLDQRAGQIQAVGLEGILAEGPMLVLSTYLTGYIKNNSQVRYLILDFRMCQGSKPSACAMLAKLHKKLENMSVILYYTNVQAEMKDRLVLFGVPEEDMVMKLSLQQALEICEDKILLSLRTLEHQVDVSVAVNLTNLDVEEDPEDILIDGLVNLVDCTLDQASALCVAGYWQACPAGTKLTTEMHRTSAMYFAIPQYSEVYEAVDVGNVSGEGQRVFHSRLGAVCGIESVVHDEPARSTFTVAVSGSRVLVVPTDKLRAVFTEEPEIDACVMRAASRQLLWRSDALAQAVFTNKGGGWIGAHFDKYTAATGIATAADVTQSCGPDSSSARPGIATAKSSPVTAGRDRRYSQPEIWAYEWMKTRGESIILSPPVPRRVYKKRQRPTTLSGDMVAVAVDIFEEPRTLSRSATIH